MEKILFLYQTRRSSSHCGLNINQKSSSIRESLQFFSVLCVRYNLRKRSNLSTRVEKKKKRSSTWKIRIDTLFILFVKHNILNLSRIKEITIKYKFTIFFASLVDVCACVCMYARVCVRVWCHKGTIGAPNQGPEDVYAF